VLFEDAVKSIKKFIEREEKIAIIGLRGVGKSTILDLISHQEWMQNSIIFRYPFTSEIGDKKVLVDDAHLAPKTIVEKAITYSSLVPLDDSRIIFIKPLTVEKIAKLLDYHGLSYSKNVPRIILQLTGGFLSYISIILNYVFFVNNRMFLSRDLIIHIMSQSHVKRILQRLAIDYLRDYQKFIDRNIIGKLVDILRGEEPNDIDNLLKIGLIYEKNGEYHIVDPILASLLRDKKKVHKDAGNTRISVKNLGFSKFYPLDNESFLVIHDKYLIAAIKSNLTEHLLKIRKIAKIIYAKQIFIITPEDAKGTKQIKIIKVPRKNFIFNAKRKIDEIISLIQRINEFPHVAHYY